MKIQIPVLFLLFSFSLLLGSCSKKEGCTDATAINFDADADKEDNSCTFASDQLIGDWTVTESVSGQTVSYPATVTAIDNDLIIINGMRSIPVIYSIPNLEMKVEWADKILTKEGTTVSGTIANENDFTIQYAFGTGTNVYSVSQHYTR